MLNDNHSVTFNSSGIKVHIPPFMDANDISQYLTLSEFCILSEITR